HVVLPEPDGPSMAKNSPGSMVSETSSTARTVPKVRATFRNSTAAVKRSSSATALYGDVVRCPLAVRNARTLRSARSFRRAPELDLVEQLDAVGLATFSAEQLVILASSRHCGQRTEPRGNVALHLRRDRPRQPLVRAVRMLGLRMH